MIKARLVIMLLCSFIGIMGCFAQQRYLLSLEQMFALADENSKTLKVETSAVLEAEQAIKVAKNGYLPDIDISLSASYLGNGTLLDRDFSNGQSVMLS